MPDTPTPRGYPRYLNTDAPNGPAQMKALADAVDADVGLVEAAALGLASVVAERVGLTGALGSATTRQLLAAPMVSAPIPAVGSAVYAGPIYLDPAEIAPTGRTARLRLRAALANMNGSAVASTANYTFGLYTLTAVGATWSLGALVAGSEPTAVNTPAAGTRADRVVDFNCPAAGWYGLCVKLSGAEGLAAGEIGHYARLSAFAV